MPVRREALRGRATAPRDVRATVDGDRSQKEPDRDAGDLSWIRATRLHQQRPVHRDMNEVTDRTDLRDAGSLVTGFAGDYTGTATIDAARGLERPVIRGHPVLGQPVGRNESEVLKIRSQRRVSRRVPGINVRQIGRRPRASGILLDRGSTRWGAEASTGRGARWASSGLPRDCRDRGGGAVSCAVRRRSLARRQHTPAMRPRHRRQLRIVKPATVRALPRRAGPRRCAVAPATAAAA